MSPTMHPIPISGTGVEPGTVIWMTSAQIESARAIHFRMTVAHHRARVSASVPQMRHNRQGFPIGMGKENGVEAHSNDPWHIFGSVCDMFVNVQAAITHTFDISGWEWEAFHAAFHAPEMPCRQHPKDATGVCCTPTRSCWWSPEWPIDDPKAHVAPFRGPRPLKHHRASVSKYRAGAMMLLPTPFPPVLH